jgi:hypothetical protein
MLIAVEHRPDGRRSLYGSLPKGRRATGVVAVHGLLLRSPTRSQKLRELGLAAAFPRQFDIDNCWRF